jgi:hypothetical protein
VRAAPGGAVGGQRRGGRRGEVTLTRHVAATERS